MAKKQRTINSYELRLALIKPNSFSLCEDIRQCSLEWIDSWCNTLMVKLCDGLLEGETNSPSQKALRIGLRAMKRYRKIAKRSNEPIVIIQAQLKCLELSHRY